MMLPLLFQLAVATAPDTVRPVAPLSPTGALAQQQQDTTRRRRPRAIEVSEAYHQRLVIHRVLSYAMVPVFVAQYVAGTKLYDEDAGGPEAPGWAKPVHSAGATSVAAIFGINTLTGAMNLWESRGVEDHRWLRWSHAAVMLGADAAFAYTGIKLASEAENSAEKRKEHRRVAVYAMSFSVASGVVMKIFNR